MTIERETSLANVSSNRPPAPSGAFNDRAQPNPPFKPGSISIERTEKAIDQQMGQPTNSFLTRPARITRTEPPGRPSDHVATSSSHRACFTLHRHS
jgi:hypothetical protein